MLFDTVEAMKRFPVATIAVTLSALAVAGPAQADEQTFLQTLRDQGQYMPPWLDRARIGGGYDTCGQLRAGAPRTELVPQFIQVDGNVFIDAAQHELCPDTLGAVAPAPAAPAPTPADEQSFVQTLRDQGQYMPPWLDRARVGGGYNVCGQLHAGVPRADLVPQIISVDGNVFIDAAQRHLCPDTLPAGQ